MLSESLARAPGGIVVPPLIVEAMVTGLACIARDRLLAGRVAELTDLIDELVEWALRYPGKSAVALAELDLQTVWRNTAFEPSIEAPNGRKRERPFHGDRSIILAAVADRAVKKGYNSLTVTSVRAGTGVSRNTFYTHFRDLEDCFLAALEERASDALAQAVRAQTAGRTWAGGLYRAIAALCDQVAEDPLLARACLTDDFPPGSRGMRARQRLASAVIEQLADSVPSELQVSAFAAEASVGAVWALFRRYVARDWVQQRRDIAATLSFLALAPAIGAPAAIAAIRREQTAT
ncbi:MAG TPA: TetR/AcrR family transcriptional regulator [Solirubrobacterales bacterium]